MKRSRKRHYKYETVGRESTIVAFQIDQATLQLLRAARDVGAHRQMNAAESPEQQDAWDRLETAVLETERMIYSKNLTNRPTERRIRPSAGTNGAP